MAQDKVNIPVPDSSNSLPASSGDGSCSAREEVRSNLRDTHLPLFEDEAAYNAYIDESFREVDAKIKDRNDEIKTEFLIDGIGLSEQQADLVDHLLFRQAIKDQRRYASAADDCARGDNADGISMAKLIAGKIRSMPTSTKIDWRAGKSAL